MQLNISVWKERVPETLSFLRNGFFSLLRDEKLERVPIMKGNGINIFFFFVTQKKNIRELFHYYF